MKRIVLSIMLGQLMLLAGCLDQEHTSAVDFIQEVKREKNAEIAPLPEIQQYENIDYTVSAMRSPFENSTDLLLNSGQATNANTTDAIPPRPDIARKRELLESYPLNTISMVGVIKKGATCWGVVKDKTGMIHRVHVGNYLGENAGYIEKITEDSIYIKETVADDKGSWTERMSLITLAK